MAGHALNLCNVVHCRQGNTKVTETLTQYKTP